MIGADCDSDNFLNIAIILTKMGDLLEEKVIMTPKSKTPTSTTLIIERKVIEAEPSDKIHIAGGDHTGIIINKEKVFGKEIHILI